MTIARITRTARHNSIPPRVEAELQLCEQFDSEVERVRETIVVTLEGVGETRADLIMAVKDKLLGIHLLHDGDEVV